MDTPRSPAPPVVVVVGAGPGVGASVARRFAREGYATGLVARNGDRIAGMAANLAAEIGVETGSEAADATDAAELDRAIRRLADRLGTPTALCFTPLPDVGLIRPVLETGPDELLDSLRLNVAGAAAAARAVLPAMREIGSGSLLFTTGSAALRPDPRRAASAVTTTAASVYIGLLRESLAGTGIRVGHTVVAGPIGLDPGSHHPDAVAEDVWSHHAGSATTFPTVLRLPASESTSYTTSDLTRSHP